MSKGNYLYIEGAHLCSAEVTGKRWRRSGEAREIAGLTASTKLVYERLHFLLHWRPEGYRQGYCSYQDIADFCGIAESTAIAAVKSLTQAGLLAKRRRRDPRGMAFIAGGKPFLAPNLYRLLVPPSRRTPEQQAEAEALLAEWRDDLEVSRPGWYRSQLDQAKSDPVSDQAQPGQVSDQADPAAELVRQFYRELGQVNRKPSRSELERAAGLIERRGLELARKAAGMTLARKPQHFGLVLVLENELLGAMGAAGVIEASDRGAGVVREELRAIQGLSARLGALWDVEIGDLEEPLGALLIRLSHDLQCAESAEDGMIPWESARAIIEEVAEKVADLEKRGRKQRA